MEIIREGKIEYRKKRYRFVCRLCDCEFIADIEDMEPYMGFWAHDMYYQGVDEKGYKVNCPTCGKELSKAAYDYIKCDEGKGVIYN